MSEILTLDRTPRAKNCKIILNKMDNIFLQHSAYLDKEDYIHFSEYLKHGYTLYDDGLFDEPETLKISPWSEFNFRYGRDSIRGTIGEMLSHMIRNGTGGRTRSRSFSHHRKDEINGKDGCIYNPKWANKFANQVKLIKFNSDRSSIMFSKRSYFQDKYTGNVDRLTLVDIEHSFFIDLDYPAISYEIVDEDEQSRIVKNVTDDIVEISVENLERYSKFRYSKISMK